MSEFNPENLPSGSTPTTSGGYGVAIFIPESGNTSLTTDLTTPDGTGVWFGYLEIPTFTKTSSSGLISYINDIGTFSLGSSSIIKHDIVITYKLTDAGSDSNILTLPSGGTTLQMALVDSTDTIYKTPIADLPQVDIVTMRKFASGVHDTIILRNNVLHANGDTVRIKFWAVNGSGVSGVRINIFSVSWETNTL